MTRSTAFACLGFVALALGACTKETPRIAEGALLTKGPVAGLYRAPDGRSVATLTDAEPAREPGAPQNLMTGSLHLSSTAPGQSRRLAGGVTNLPNALLFSSDGKWLAFLSGYSIARARGELQWVKTSGDAQPESLSTDVTYYTFSDDARHIAWVSDGVLSIRDTEGGEPKVVTQGVSMMAFGPKDTLSSTTLLIKRGVKAGGGLLSYDTATGALKAIAAGTRTFAFAPNGDAAFQAASLVAADQLEPASVLARKVGDGDDLPSLYLSRGNKVERISSENVAEFRFSRDGKRLAFLTPPKLGQATGDLWMFDGTEAKRVVTRVQSFGFAADSKLVLLGAWETASNAGTLGVAGSDGKLHEVARTVKQFSISSKGDTVLFSQIVPVGGTYSLALSVQALDAVSDTPPRQIATGAFGYALSKDEAQLAYKAVCLDHGKACSLFVTPLAAAGESHEIGERVAAFDFLPDRNALVVVNSRHMGKHDPRLLYTIGVLTLGGDATFKVLDDHMNGEFTVANDKLVWISSEEGREGVYSAPF